MFNKIKKIYNKSHTFGLNLLAIVAVFSIGGFLGIGVYHTAVFAGMKLLPAVLAGIVPPMTIFFAAGVIFLKDPVHNLLCLIAVFFSGILLYLCAGAEFLAFLFLIVYVGAIAILFLFVIMLLQLKKTTTNAQTLTRFGALAVMPLSFIMIAGLDTKVSTTLTNFLWNSNVPPASIDTTTTEALVQFIDNQFIDILTFSAKLYTAEAFLFYLAAMLLLTAMLGAIVLAAGATDKDETTYFTVAEEAKFPR